MTLDKKQLKTLDKKQLKTLDNTQLKKFRAIGHGLNPVVTVANGLSDNVKREIDRALADHELIKVKVVTEDREEKKALMTEICQQTGAELVQQIGHMALLYKAATKPNPKLSNILRHK